MFRTVIQGGVLDLPRLRSALVDHCSSRLRPAVTLSGVGTPADESNTLVCSLALTDELRDLHAFVTRLVSDPAMYLDGHDGGGSGEASDGGGDDGAGIGGGDVDAPR